MAFNLGDLIVRVMAQVEPFLTDMEKVSASVDKTVSDTTAKFKGFDALAGKMSDLGGAMSLGLTAPIAALGGLGIQAAAEFESMEKGLTAVEGSSEAAGKELEELREIAKLPGLGLPEAVEGYTRLRAVGVEADKAERYLSAFGNALATVGKGRADLEAVVGQLVQMSTKTQVVAEDLKPIMERVPQVAQITKAIYGTIDTEALQKAGVTTKDYLAAVLPELEKLPKITGGLGNSIENLQDTAKQALTRIGEAFAPVAAVALPVVEKILTGIADLAKQFTELPAPVQAGIGTLVALAAAIGPVLLAIGQITSVITTAMPALAGMAEFFGVTVAALGGWALAIAAVAAALVAFGVWVYQNWDGVSAVLKQAWDGIAEMWESVWGPLLPYIKAIWDSVSKVTVAAWNGISDALSTVWNGIKSVAAKVWGGIVDVFQTFLKWAAKIPGANKLINLDEAWTSAKKATEALEKTATATKNMGNSATTAAPKVDILTAAVKKKAAGHTEAEKAAIRNQKANEDMAARYDKLAGDIIAAATKLNEVTRQLEKSNADLAITFGAAHEKMRAEALKTVEVIVPASERIPKIVQDAIRKNKDLEAAYKDLGITSKAELEKIAAEAEKNYQLIKDSGTAAPRDIEAAWVAFEEARIKAAKAAGETIPAEQLKALEKMKGQLEGKLPEQTSKWSEWSKQVSTIVTDFSNEAAKTLFDGDLSWGEKGKKMLDSLGQAFSRAFIEPATKALGDFISGALADLIGGKGLGGVLDRITSIGEGFSKVFEGGASAAGGAGSIPGGGAPSIPGGGGAGAAIGSGLAPWISAISGAVSAISSVIGNFQMAKQETSLNAIEHNTRYTMMYVGERADGGILGQLFKITENTRWTLGGVDELSRKSSESISILADSYGWMERIGQTLEHLSGPLSLGSTAARAIESTVNGIAGTLGELRNTAADIRAAMQSGGGQWTVTFTGDPIAAQVGQQIMSQLRAQGAKIV